MSVDGDVNARWLDMLYLNLQTVNSFSGKTVTITNTNAYVFSAYAPAPNYAYLTTLTISVQSNVFEGKALINQIPNPSVVIE
jgi:hypothetical protein